MNDTRFVNRQVLIEDAKLLLADTQELLQLIADQASENVTDLRFRLEDKITQYKKDLSKLQDASVTNVRQVGQVADEYVHHEPWTAIGTAAGFAFVVGLLVGRGGRQ